MNFRQSSCCVNSLCFLLLPLAVFAVIRNLMSRADPLFKSETLKGVPFPYSVAMCSPSQVDFKSVLPGGSSPLKQPHPLMTVLPAQLEWNVADTGTRFNTAATGAQNKWPHFFCFFCAIKHINCKHLCRRSEWPRIFRTQGDNVAALSSSFHSKFTAAYFTWTLLFVWGEKQHTPPGRFYQPVLPVLMT